MERLLQAEIGELILWGALVAVATAVAIYAIGKIRAKPAQQEPVANELMSNLRKLHCQGELSDEEFRTIKTALTAQLQQELKDNGEKG